MSADETNDEGMVTGINVTPMVDIMLVLLIIFMVTAHFVSDSGQKINLPKTSSVDAPAAAGLMVSINEKGELFIKKDRTDRQSLKFLLTQEAKHNPGVRVTLAADNKLSYQQVMTVLDLIKQAGVRRVALASQR
ncbi:MAG: biopolymer transporter ExbD [Elusimicrobiota bacterium]